mgnify:CR=1 FL=1|jgi:exodeoxyribonuclease VII large subunit
MDKEIYTVSDISLRLQALIKSKWSYPITVRGELSNCKTFKGNLFASLKDESASLDLIQWGPEITLNEGDKVVVTGMFSSYPRRSNYRIIASKIQKEGVGDLYQDYIKIKEKYQKMRYFSTLLKKPLPKYIRRVGIVTSLDGAALQDMLFIFNQKKFTGNIYLRGCTAQGVSCPSSVAKGIEYFDNFKDDGKSLDVIVITRGGGSFEDLFGFSDPLVIEAIYKSNTCVISAVGHEIDTMLSDLAADIRSPTPSFAGEIITNQQRKEIDLLTQYETIHFPNLSSNISNQIHCYQEKILKIRNKIKSPTEYLKQENSKLDAFEGSLSISLNHSLSKFRIRLNTLSSNLRMKNPKNILENGYAIVVNENGKRIMNKLECEKYKKLKLIFSDGEIVVINK